ncbi:hypothetical protein [Rhodovulum sp. YEN HP10]|uniref:hypothetical protein n=1 Tax=Rhodovulum sp. HP10 TaxID=3387397 RepID=UPI0039DF691B
MTMTLVVVGLLVLAFGWIIDRIVASKPNCICKILTLTDTNLLKTILVAIGTASILVFAGQIHRSVDVGHLAVSSAHGRVLPGGGGLGFGWAIAVGRIDALCLARLRLLFCGTAVRWPVWMSVAALGRRVWAGCQEVGRHLSR